MYASFDGKSPNLLFPLDLVYIYPFVFSPIFLTNSHSSWRKSFKTSKHDWGFALMCNEGNFYPADLHQRFLCIGNMNYSWTIWQYPTNTRLLLGLLIIQILLKNRRLFNWTCSSEIVLKHWFEFIKLIIVCFN